jgi:hypothetical protein
MNILYQVEYCIPMPLEGGSWQLLHGMDQRQFENKYDAIELGRKLNGVFHVHETTGRKLSWKDWILFHTQRRYGTSFENIKQDMNRIERLYA